MQRTVQQVYTSQLLDLFAERLTLPNPKRSQADINALSFPQGPVGGQRVVSAISILEAQVGPQQQIAERLTTKARNAHLAIECLTANRLGDIRFIERHEKRFDTTVHWASSLGNFIFKLEARLLQDQKFDPILDYIQLGYEAIPISSHLSSSIPIEEREQALRSVNEQVSAEVVKGKLGAFYAPQSEVERWIQDQSSTVTQMFYEWLQEQPEYIVNGSNAETPPLKAAQALLGIEIHIRAVVQRALSQYYGTRNRSAAPTDEESSISTISGIGIKVGEALRYATWRDIFSDPRRSFQLEEVEDVLEQLWFSGDRSYRIHGKAQSMIGEHFDVINENLGGLSCACAIERSRPVAQTLARRLKNSLPAKEGAKISTDAPRVLPHGDIFVVDDRSESEVCYHADGVSHLGRIVVPMTDKEFGRLRYEDEAVARITDEYQLEDYHTIALDDGGKWGRSYGDRLVPPIEGDQWRESQQVFTQIDRAFTEYLWTLSGRFPGIFSELIELGPYVVVRGPECELLFCKNESVGQLAPFLEVHHILPTSDPTLLGDFSEGIFEKNDFSPFLINDFRSDESTVCRAIRNALPNPQVVDYPVFLTSLAPFRVSAVPEHGGNSDLLVRDMKGRELSFPVATWVKHNRNGIPFDFLLQTLDALKIDRGGYLRSLEDR